VDKRVIKEAAQGAVEGLGNAAPTIIGGMAGASLEAANIKIKVSYILFKRLH